MSVRPQEPTTLGTFFAYPADATGTVSDYWLAGGGAKFRMTGACKRALLATFEAAIERAVCIANIATMGDGVNLQNARLGISGDLFSFVTLDRWELGAGRASLGSALVRGCPFEEWNQLAEIVWRLWTANVYTLTYNGVSCTVYAWQTGYQNNDTAGWIDDDVLHTLYLGWLYDLSGTPCDDHFVSEFMQRYAPWGTHTGPQYGGSVVLDWLVNQLNSQMREFYETGTPGPMESMADGMLGRLSPHPLGLIASGKIGNWFSFSNGEMSATGLRRSSASWAVLQAMLAHMRYTHLAFSFSVNYTETTQTLHLTRVFTLDASTLDFVIYELPAQNSSYTTTYSDILQSGSSIYGSDGSATVGFTFEIEKGSPAELALVKDFPPFDFEESIDGRDYVQTIEAVNDGVVTVDAERRQTDAIDSITVQLPGTYPASRFSSYVVGRGGVTFVDQKINTDGTRAHSIRIETDTGDLGAVVRAHAEWLLDQVNSPRAFPTPGSLPSLAVKTASDLWWGSWKLRYPSTPNYPANSPNPDKYFPIGIINPTGELQLFTEDSRSYKCQNFGGEFGALSLAFPDYPFGWTNSEDFQILAGIEALAAYEWQFKAMPAN